jgi:mannose-1-phosphate guanylyltransferase/mannose-6-phosphate isomerase
MLVPVILSGGVGARLWPVSRETYPKPFMKLQDGHSLIQKTFQRVLSLAEVSELMVVTNRDHFFQTADEFSALATPEASHLSFLLEPCGRNTAPAIAMAALSIADRFGADTPMLVLPADHLIENLDEFSRVVTLAKQLAAQGSLVTFGLTPRRPDTGFGYIEQGSQLDGISGGELAAFRVQRFVEKPDEETARTYVDSGRYLWNAGIFCFTAGQFLATLQQTAADVFTTVERCWQQSSDFCGPLQMDEESFRLVPDISVDYAVMERADNVAVIRCDLGWNDIGSWTALSDLTPADGDGNRCEGEVLMVDSHDCYIRSEKRLVATVGVDHLFVVDTDDALLIAHQDHAQDVKKVVQELKKQGHPSYRRHNTVHRPWGTYTELEQGDRFKIKRIVVKPEASLSLQMHYHRCEHWVVVSGTARIINGDKEILLNVNESTFIPIGHRHRLENPGKVPLVLIEVQSGEYLEEDDIVRFDDIYGRKEEQDV